MSFKTSRLWKHLRSRQHQHYIGLLTNALQGCHTALDLGCGAEPYLGECYTIESVTGVDGSYKSCSSARRADKYVSTVQAVLPDLPFSERSVDAVTLLQVVEHLPKDVASKLIIDAERVARRKIIITTPNGFVAQEAFDENPFQEHLSGWSIEDFRERGYTVWGMEGPKAARRKGSAEMLFPQRLLSVLNSFGTCEGYLRDRPQHAFQLFAVKTVES